jgi:hypothetical protein
MLIVTYEPFILGFTSKHFILRVTYKPFILRVTYKSFILSVTYEPMSLSHSDTYTECRYAKCYGAKYGYMSLIINEFYTIGYFFLASEPIL